MSDNANRWDDHDDTAKPNEAVISDALHTISARRHLREQLQADMAAFLANGGRINTVADNVLADPPKKPRTDYGSRPI